MKTGIKSDIFLIWKQFQIRNFTNLKCLIQKLLPDETVVNPCFFDINFAHPAHAMRFEQAQHLVETNFFFKVFRKNQGLQIFKKVGGNED